MSTIKTYCIIIVSLLLISTSACRDDRWEVTPSAKTEGKFTIELDKPAPTVVDTRADNEQEEETVENVAVLVYDQSDVLVNGFVEHSADNIRYIDVYLTDNDKEVYVVCNHPNPEQLVAEAGTLTDLFEQKLTIANAGGAFPGHYVMSGHSTVASIKKDGNRKIPVFRLASHLDFHISVDTSLENGGDGGEFKLTSAYLCNLPKGSYIIDGDEGNEPPAEGSLRDFPFSNTELTPTELTPDEIRANYFTPVRLNVKDEADTWTASYDMFENRRGSITDSEESWPELRGLESHENYLQYKQLYKRTRAKDYPNHIMQIEMGKETTNDELDQLPEVKEGRFYNATYLRIDGVYTRVDGASYKTSYYVYLGADNYRDFNVRRNYLYDHYITIRSYANFDHRVTGSLLNGLNVFADFDVLDAHFNVVKAMLYAPEGWTVYVKDPDKTPWLEVSHSANYKPRIAGKPTTGDEAAFSITGGAGFNYFYVHTDEYIPETSRPEENMTMLLRKTRKGTIVCKCKNITQEYEIEQQPAHLVILHIKYDVHTMKEVRDTFYIERKLEHKYMPWGFMHYWSYLTDDLIASGTWDGLSNTRKLYDVALNGQKDKNGKQIFPPAYPQGLSADHALGYVIAKNRDRNGNGKIDYNEITWYWPATKELKQIREAIYKAQVEFDSWDETFFASTPSSSDKYGMTPGYAVSLKMKDDSEWLPVRRDRKLNVICCRRKNAWKGPQTGGTNGDVTTDDDWETGDEVIIPRR